MAAELVAYSGFSASNYLEQPYNSDLDFGTGDFYFIGWVKQPSTANKMLFDRATPSTGGVRTALYVWAGVYYVQIASTNHISPEAPIADTWQMLSITRIGGACTFSINGTAVYTFTENGNVNNSSASLFLGVDYASGTPANGCEFSLFRIGAGAPTAAQIADIYNMEKHLFTDNTKCTLQGSSDSVLALDYDSTTEELHSMTSYGRTSFNGLSVVSDEATSVGTPTAVSGGRGIISQAGSTAVDVYVPEINLRESSAESHASKGENTDITSIRGDVRSSDGTKVLDNGTDGTDATFTGDLTGGIVEIGSSIVMNMKVINIGDWDMDATATITVAHGLDNTKIRTASAMIRPDSGSGTDILPLDMPDTSTFTHEGGIPSITTTDVALSRAASGFFDTTAFNSTSYNRGWITIWYTD